MKTFTRFAQWLLGLIAEELPPLPRRLVVVVPCCCPDCEGDRRREFGR